MKPAYLANFLRHDFAINDPTVAFEASRDIVPDVTVIAAMTTVDDPLSIGFIRSLVYSLRDERMGGLNQESSCRSIKSVNPSEISRCLGNIAALKDDQE